MLGLHHVPRGGASGELLGRGTGSSLEFHDRRPYVPGDDVRHIDWRALAKGDEVLVRVHQEEVAPRLDLFLDVSMSMGTADDKAQRAVDLATVLAHAARSGGYDVRLVLLGDQVLRVPFDQFAHDGIAFDSKRPMGDLAAEAADEARPNSVRIVVSDFLVPVDPMSLVQPFGRGAGRVALLQVLSSMDAEPQARGAMRMVDAELGEVREVVIDRAAIGRYRERLDRLQAGLAEASVRHGGVFHTQRSDEPLTDALTGLAGLGVLE